MPKPEVMQIGFRLEVWLQGMIFNPARAEGLSFAIKGDPELRLSVRPRDPNNDPFGSQRGIACKVQGSFPATQSEKDFVVALLQRRFKPYKGMPIKLPYVKHGQEQINADGAMREGFGLPFEAYPPRLQKICDNAKQVLLSAATRFLKLLIWHLQIDAPPNFIQTSALYWGIKEGNYYIVGLKRQEISANSPVGITWDEGDRLTLQALWDTGAQEPLAHELLREAKMLSGSSPRSALLTVATALETGVKTYIAQTAPQTKGLIDKLPSPPIDQLFRNYLPILHASLGQDVPYWGKLKRLFKSCEELFKDRNNLTHARSAAVEPKQLATYIDTASDLLYLLDVLEGHCWAKGYVRLARQELGWPGPRHHRTKVTMLSHDL
jgi:hypothetical protein